MPFFLHITFKMNLIKMQIPPWVLCVVLFLHLLEICLATIGVCVFCALASVGALFIFGGDFMIRLNENLLSALRARILKSRRIICEGMLTAVTISKPYYVFLTEREMLFYGLFTSDGFVSLINEGSLETIRLAGVSRVDCNGQKLLLTVQCEVFAFFCEDPAQWKGFIEKLL